MSNSVRNPAAAASDGDELAIILTDLAGQILAVDPKGGASVLKDLQQYLVEYDPAIEYHNLETYLQYRTMNIGMNMLICLMKWCLDINLSDADNQAIADFYAAATRVVILTNDYFSWDLDKRTSKGARIPNIIPVMMDEFHLSEEEARIHLKGMIVEAEQICRRRGNALKHDPPSQTVKSYVEAMELFIGGGNGFWSASCPRYNDTSASW